MSKVILEAHRSLLRAVFFLFLFTLFDILVVESYWTQITWWFASENTYNDMHVSQRSRDVSPNFFISSYHVALYLIFIPLFFTFYALDTKQIKTSIYSMWLICFGSLDYFYFTIQGRLPNFYIPPHIDYLGLTVIQAFIISIVVLAVVEVYHVYFYKTYCDECDYRVNMGYKPVQECYECDLTIFDQIKLNHSILIELDLEVINE
jgi:hypothetical protein